MAGEPKSYLDLARECDRDIEQSSSVICITTLINIDSLPYVDQVEEYTLLTSTLYRFCSKKSWYKGSNGLVTVGYILSSVVAKMLWISKFHLDYSAGTVIILYVAGTDIETTAIREQLESAR